MADINPICLQFAQLFWRHPNFSISFLVNISHLLNSHSHKIGYGALIFAGSHESDKIITGFQMSQNILHVAPCCFIVIWLSSTDIEFIQCRGAVNCVIE
jgi:hypothetical protein